VGIGKAFLIVVAKFGQVMFQSGILMNWKLGFVLFFCPKLETGVCQLSEKYTGASPVLQT